MEINNGKSFGKRIKENLGKRWQGAKNIFGNKDAENLKKTLNKLKTTADIYYDKLDPTKEQKELICDNCKKVWGAVRNALKEISSLCEDVEEDQNGNGRSYAKYIIEKCGELNSNVDTFSLDNIYDFNGFEGEVIALQLIANNTSRTSLLPRNIKDAASAVSRFYAYCYAYSCINPIVSKMQEVEETLKKNSLWQKIKNIFTKKIDTVTKQIDIDVSKVAKAIYSQAMNAKIRQSLHTKEYMKYFKNCIKDFFGVYSDLPPDYDIHKTLYFIDSRTLNSSISGELNNIVESTASSIKVKVNE